MMIIQSMLKILSGETYAEVSAHKSKDELVSQVQSKYALDKVQAQKDVDAFARGRQL